MSEFPVDDATLVMLAESCRINPETGRSHLMDFLDFGTVVEHATLERDGSDGTAPVMFVEYEKDRGPFSPHGVILALIGEIQRLRETHSGSEGGDDRDVRGIDAGWASGSEGGNA